MREFKFRAWDKHVEKMLFWNDLYSYDLHGFFDDPTTEDDIIFMQYTGLKDKNDKEIYDGDILKSFAHPDIPLLHKIEWSDKYNGWFAKNVNNKGSDYKTGDVQLFVYAKHNDFGIIGNMYENPGLLEGE
jgi:uncharacterized phage protein (TIGR01671 family)